jgi:hypothetical protein
VRPGSVFNKGCVYFVCAIPNPDELSLPGATDEAWDDLGIPGAKNMCGRSDTVIKSGTLASTTIFSAIALVWG